MNISICDLDSCAYLIGYTYHDADYNTVMQKVDSMMHSILQATQAHGYIGFLGGEGNFRYAVAKTKPYKGNRSKDQPEWLQQWKKPINDHLIAEWGAIVVNNIEADDAIGICWKYYNSIVDELSNSNTITICSPDKDLKQFSGWNYDYKKQEHHLIDEHSAAKHFWTSVLCGDVADNIPGAKGIGDKGAAKWLEYTYNWQHMSDRVVQAYESKGHSFDYYLEQYTLLKMLEYPAYGFSIPKLLPVKNCDPFAIPKVYVGIESKEELNDNHLTSLGF